MAEFNKLSFNILQQLHISSISELKNRLKLESLKLIIDLVFENNKKCKA